MMIRNSRPFPTNCVETGCLFTAVPSSGMEGMLGEGRMEQIVRGTVRVASTTHRLGYSLYGNSLYGVARPFVGAFTSSPRIELGPATMDSQLTRDKARSAIRQAKTSWGGPSFPG